MDGAAFWKKYEVHHPFLLPQYRGDGRKYHQSFARIGFTADHAAQVSFVELLHVPTVGRSKLEQNDLLASHLAALDYSMTKGAARYVFLPSGVLRMMRRSGKFPWLPRMNRDDASPLRVVCQANDKHIYEHLNFSVYGRFQTQKDREAEAIKSLVAD